MIGSGLATRGEFLAHGAPLPEYLEEHFIRSASTGQPAEQPYVGLAVAENKLVWQFLDEKLNGARDVPATATGYTAKSGAPEFRSAVAAFASANVWGSVVTEDEIVTMAGAGSVLDALFYAIADPDDVVLIPTPSYAGFWIDLETRAGVRIATVDGRADDGFRLTTEALEEAYATAEGRVRSLLLTNPANPTGRIHSDEELIDAVAWARSKGIHVVVNEVYALSAFGKTPFRSVMQLVEPGDDLHYIWAFSKDFALSGFRAGVLVSRNRDVRSAVTALAFWSAISTDTQHVLTNMLTDEDWLRRYLAGMRVALAGAYEATIAALDETGIEYFPSDAGLFLLADFRAFLDEPTWEAEHRLWRRILDRTNVNLTPGAACHNPEPGLLRICFAQEPADVVADAVRRLATAL